MSRTRSVLVTGSSTGIGEATAQRLDRSGWKVFAGVRRDEDGERLQRDASARLTPIRLDITDTAQIEAAMATIAAEVGEAGLDALVNNAGVSFAGPIEVLPLDHWRDQFEVNVIGQVAVTKAALPMLRLATGRVVFISSISGRVAPGFLGPYAASKFAVGAIGAALRREVAPWGIRVAIVEPGVIDTPIWDKGQDLAEFERSVDPDALDLYRPYLEGIIEHVAAERTHGIPSSTVAEVIEHALTAAHPKHRYLVGRDAKVLGRLQRILPDRVFGKVEFMVRARLAR